MGIMQIPVVCYLDTKMVQGLLDVILETKGPPCVFIFRFLYIKCFY